MLAQTALELRADAEDCLLGSQIPGVALELNAVAPRAPREGPDFKRVCEQEHLALGVRARALVRCRVHGPPDLDRSIRARNVAVTRRSAHASCKTIDHDIGNIRARGGESQCSVYIRPSVCNDLRCERRSQPPDRWVSDGMEQSLGVIHTHGLEPNSSAGEFHAGGFMRSIRAVGHGPHYARTAMSRTPAKSVIVLCPTRIEHDAVRKGLGRFDSASTEIVQTGVGKHAILKTLTRRLDSASTLPLVILAGTCGGLVHSDDTPHIARVIDEHGRVWLPTIGASDQGVTLVGVDRVISTPQAKRELHQTTRAAIVDMETHALAQFCVERGVAWSVVRGVSDTPDETLPEAVLGWITPEGNTRIPRAVWDMVLSPRLVPHIAAVMRRASRVLPKVANRVMELSREWQSH